MNQYISLLKVTDTCYRPVEAIYHITGNQYLANARVVFLSHEKLDENHARINAQFLAQITRKNDLILTEISSFPAEISAIEMDFLSKIPRGTPVWTWAEGGVDKKKKELKIQLRIEKLMSQYFEIKNKVDRSLAENDWETLERSDGPLNPFFSLSSIKTYYVKKRIEILLNHMRTHPTNGKSRASILLGKYINLVEEDILHLYQQRVDHMHYKSFCERQKRMIENIIRGLKSFKRVIVVGPAKFFIKNNIYKNKLWRKFPGNFKHVIIHFNDKEPFVEQNQVKLWGNGKPLMTFPIKTDFSLKSKITQESKNRKPASDKNKIERVDPDSFQL